MEVTVETLRAAFYGIGAFFVIMVTVAKIIDSYQKIKGFTGAGRIGMEKKIEGQEERLKKAERNLDRDNERLTKLEHGQSAIMAALFAVLGQATGEGNEEECKRARKELQEHLIKQ